MNQIDPSSFQVNDDDDQGWVQDDPIKSMVVKPKRKEAVGPVIMVETAFLATTASLIWLINFYFPPGPFLRFLLPIPLTLAYLRWGKRAGIMCNVTSALLLSVLMGPSRSILYTIPFGWLGVHFGLLWSRQSSWLFSMTTGTIIATIGFFFRVMLLSILLGENLWGYVMTQMTAIADWIFVRLGILSLPSLELVQAIAVVMIVLNNIVYIFAVHLIALYLFDRLGVSIPRPPRWLEVILDRE